MEKWENETGTVIIEWLLGLKGSLTSGLLDVRENYYLKGTHMYGNPKP